MYRLDPNYLEKIMDRRTFLITSGLTSLAAVAVTAEPGFAAEGSNGLLRIKAGFLEMRLSDTGRVTSLVDLRNGTDYVAADKSVPLVSIVADGQQEVPSKVQFSPRDKVLSFRSSKATIDVKVTKFPTYSSLEVVGLTAAPGVDVQTLLWGPVPTSVTQTIGETAGVVRNDVFAFGLRPLNDKTVGGWPNEYLSFGFDSDLDWDPYGLQSPLKDDWKASNVAAKTTWGSVLRASTYDYSKARIRQRTNGYEISLGPLPAPEGQIVGSKIALFGSAPDLALTVLSQIAKEQGLAYPTLSGQWQKAAQRTSQSHFWLHDLNTSNVTAASQYAKQAGIKNIYAIAGDGPWVSHGHYQFNSAFGSSDAAAAGLVAAAAKYGIDVGVHTLSDFIDAHDPYVQPAPADPRLALGGRVRLTRPLGASDTTAYVDADRPLGPGLDGKRLRVGDEFVTYNTVTKISDTEWEVSGLGRAQWGSAAQSHPAGTSAARVNVNGYGGAIGDLPIIDEIATRLATAYNNTGIRATSYDGLESAGYTGWGGYGFARLVNGVYRQLDSKDEFVTECSNLSSNTWDAQSRASWGEIGRTDYAQIIRSNTFYRANYLPGMMGQQGLSGNSSLQTIEATMARAASLDAGINFETSVKGLASGSNTAALLAAVSVWESARNAGAFTAEQKKLLGDPNTYWHLSPVTPDKEWSLQQLDSTGNPVGAPQAVKAPTPGFVNPEPPEARVDELYEFKVTSSTPQTLSYEITAGALPAGLTLNKDTGGITGIPTSAGAGKFTITAHNGSTTPEATISYELKVTPRT
ncbi:Ig domain-containing protein [Saccharopolyspora shandongensis]|uniref:Ig domain-containing protein n=1 Tax=Saccharopolyspora shandongensis TaxID=418495 RepID=UPI0033C2E98E